MFKIPFRTKKPKSPAINEEIKIINFELFIIVSLSNASKVTKIDIVNPIPAKVLHQKLISNLDLLVICKDQTSRLKK